MKKKIEPKGTRLDRIEKGLEAFLRGTLELKESQQKTDAQILELKESQKRTGEYLNRTIERLDRIGMQIGDLGLLSL